MQQPDRPRLPYQASKSEGKIQIPYEISYMWNLNNDTNQHIYETKQTHRYRQHAGMLAGRERVGGRKEVWDKRS